MASPTHLDLHGQPYNVSFNRARRTERDLSELLGLARGMLADGVVSEAEANYLYDWGEKHRDAMDCWPVGLIFSKLHRFLEDGHIDANEQKHLNDLLRSLVGGELAVMYDEGVSTTLPLDQPAPLICWGPDEVYVFTGKFAYGPRADCQREVIKRDARCEDNVTRLTSFLVIGTFGSRDWSQSSFGRKIRRAVELRSAGFPIRIVGEDHWAAAVLRHPQTE
jgi:hypothetical protein